MPSRAQRVGLQQHVIPSGANEVSVVEGSPSRRMAPSGRECIAPFGVRGIPRLRSPPARFARDDTWSHARGHRLDARRQRGAQTRRPATAATAVRTVFRSLGWPKAHRHPSERNTVLTYCAAGSRGPKLCLWRHRVAQTVSPATLREPNCAPDDNQGSFLAARCREMHSLGRGLSSGAQFGKPAVARNTVWAARCREGHSLRRGAGLFCVTRWESRARRMKRRGCDRIAPFGAHGILRLRSPSARSAQDDAALLTSANPLSPAMRSQASISSPWSGCVPDDGARPNCASGDNWRDKLCIWRHAARQTVHPATTMGCFGPLAVAVCTVWAAGCRPVHSLVRGLSPPVEFAGQLSPPVEFAGPHQPD